MKQNKNDKSDKQPNYFDQLSNEDKIKYQELKKQLSLPACKNRRNKSNETFQDMVNAIQSFVVRNDENDITRSLVCGIVWLDNGIAINTHQLSIITNKCKSSINGSFQSLGYGTTPTGTESSTEIISKFPFMKKNFGELRQWTVRQKLSQPSSQSLNLREIVQKHILNNSQENSQSNTSSNSYNEEDITPPEEELIYGGGEFSLTEYVRNLIKKRSKPQNNEKMAESLTENEQPVFTEKPSIQEDSFTIAGTEFEMLDGFFNDM
ncbi:hypothetical protein TRFO_09797 [Tritrichomonas foetus]|uniref:Initiator binding domain-containing protein n=1 Tax=Tritrichomonas foetus TaxID=1144522 RepID=A0A1J4JBS5_9EUKA|nr:hypothetical protein TRFO_09797 [Tritrichomonas foetus]|eukprot:OHS96650.1 hypothetical protein TRFO_09797 [Tritrichomonas foetus]